MSKEAATKMEMAGDECAAKGVLISNVLQLAASPAHASARLTRGLGHIVPDLRQPTLFTFPK